MSDHRMEHGSHKDDRPKDLNHDRDPRIDEQERVPETHPSEPKADSHEPLDAIPANEGGEGD